LRFRSGIACIRAADEAADLVVAEMTQAARGPFRCLLVTQKFGPIVLAFVPVEVGQI